MASNRWRKVCSDYKLMAKDLSLMPMRPMSPDAQRKRRNLIRRMRYHQTKRCARCRAAFGVR